MDPDALVAELKLEPRAFGWRQPAAMGIQPDPATTKNKPSVKSIAAEAPDVQKLDSLQSTRQWW